MNQHTNPSQESAILSHLQSGKPLTPIDALNLFGCFRLGARVYSLKKQGHAIITEDYTLPNGKRVARYWLTGQTKLPL